MKLILVDNYPRLCLFAKRTIKCGEELRYDYGDAHLPWRQKSNIYEDDGTNDESDDDPFDTKHEIVETESESGEDEEMEEEPSTDSNENGYHHSEEEEKRSLVVHPDEQQKGKSESGPEMSAASGKKKKPKKDGGKVNPKEKAESQSESDGDEVKHVGFSTGSDENVVHPPEHQMEESASSDFDKIDSVDIGYHHSEEEEKRSLVVHPDEQQKEKSESGPEISAASGKKKPKKDEGKVNPKEKAESQSESDGDEVKHIGSSTGNDENVVHPDEQQKGKSASSDFDKIDSVDTEKVESESESDEEMEEELSTGCNEIEKVESEFENGEDEEMDEEPSTGSDDAAVCDIEADEDDDESYHPSEDEGIESTSTCTCSSNEDTSTLHDLDLCSESAMAEHVSDSECSENDDDEEISCRFPLLDSGEKKIIFQEAKKTTTGKYDNKKHSCLFCEKVLANMARHYTLVHFNEPQVAKILILPKKSKERRQLWEKLVNNGDFEHNYSVIEKGHGVIIPKYRKESSESVVLKDYVPCFHCKGMYKKTDLWKHTSQCSVGSKTLHSEKQNHVKLGRLLFPSTCANKHFQEKVLSVMKDDEIKTVIVSDKRIIDFGSRMFEKHGKDEHKNIYISQKLRELGRLVKCSKNQSLNSVDELLCTNNWDTLIKCVKEVAGYSEESHTFTTPSLALKLGHSLQKSANFLKSEGLKENDDDKIKTAESFLSLYENDWTDAISSQALSSLHDKKYNKPLLMPLVEDVKKLNCYLEKEARRLCSDADPCLYNELAQVCLAQIILFNRRRSGEAERMTLSAYKETLATGSGKPDEVVLSTLSEFERTLCHSHLRVEIRGKRGRKVPVLFTKTMKESIDILISMREKANVTQPYLFSRPGSFTKPFRGTDCIRRFSKKAGLQDPNSINSTKLRKQLATLAQVLNLSETSQDILATFQGHNIRVHREFYRLPENALQVAKVSKLLHCINNGMIQKYRGKDFDEIDFIDTEKVESESESDEDEEMEEELSTGCNENVDHSPEHQIEKSASRPESYAASQKKKKIKKDVMIHNPKVPARHHWTLEEKGALKKHFRKDIASGQTPRQLNCLTAIKKEPCLKKFTWKQIKFAVKNLITTHQRQLQKLHD
nr:uncharacterized protein LOC111106281 isoform X2 [Crassostrea virginica]